ncbi:hypothetical protein C8Q79DRAFT_73214 [Trametes meyenii]|nr:hypothetical protein C8Q79DRAFT_73214 [Trametes meyenii]
MSTNPWKITATFQTIASTRDEYMAILEKVQGNAPSEPKAGERRSKLEIAHLALLKALHERVEIIDNELAVSFCLSPGFGVCEDRTSDWAQFSHPS